ncbi:MAG TPA: sulfite exporter TauE/SafE family protein [Bacilli bacterium]|nr:sulfite exporter TauE/SafE family protein [Bacilli bacterium]
MSIVDVAVYVTIGLIGSFCSGLLGVGGAIVTYPLLFFVPPLFGAYAMTPNEISSTTMLQVFASTGIGMLMYRKSPWLDRRVVWVIGGGMLGGSLLGSFFSGFMPGLAIHLTYGLMALLAVVLMLRKQPGDLQEEAVDRLSFNAPLAIALSFGVGCLSGVVGAGGSFLLIPLMIRVLKLPTRTAIASSLTVVFLSSFGGSIGKVAGGHVLYSFTAVIVGASFVGAMIGARVGQRTNVQILRVALAVIILLSALNIWGDVFLTYYESL